MAFCLEEFDRQYIVELAKNLLKDIGRPIFINETLSCHVGASIGIVTSSERDSDLEALLAKADHAMYEV